MNEEERDIPGQTPERPVIVIERDDDPGREGKRRNARGRGTRMPALAAAVLASAALAACGFLYRLRYVRAGVPISCTPEENIAKLRQEAGAERPEVLFSTDSILGVRLNLYEIHGLRAEITLQEPDTSDASVYLYSRCADHTASGKYLGSIVMEGKELAEDVSRMGYCAIADGNIVIGVSRSEKVKDYVMGRKGFFFRQFVLVSDGVLPSRFHLHGKVERRGLGRIGETLYYIEAPHPETMWDFADALREYGFTDAIYITGGRDYGFRRDSAGVRHGIGDVSRYPHKKGKGVIPWIVFRKRDGT